MSTRSIWYEPEHDTSYLIPDDAELPEGTVLLRSLTGKSRSVDPEAVAPFLVDKDEVSAHLRSQIDHGIDKLRDLFTTVKDAWEASSSDSKPARPQLRLVKGGAELTEAGEGEPSPGESTQSARDGTIPTEPRTVPSERAKRLWKGLTGLDPDQAAADPAILRQGFGQLLDELKLFLLATTTGDQRVMQDARAHMKSLRQRLAANGFPMDEAADDIPQTLHEALHDDGTLQRLHEQADQFDAEAQALATLAERAREQLKAAAANLAQTAAAIDPEEDPKLN